MTTMATAAAGAVRGGITHEDEVTRQRAAALLQYTHGWLERAAPQAPPVAGAVPALVSATGLYEARQYEACVGLVLTVITELQRIRSAYPALPPL